MLEASQAKSTVSDTRADGNSTVDGSDIAPRIARRLRIRRIVAQPDTAGGSRRSDNSGHEYQCRSHARSTQPGAPSWCRLRGLRVRELSQGERRLLRQRL
jgi:hypothetical protein